jgi:hypothetical protein
MVAHGNDAYQSFVTVIPVAVCSTIALDRRMPVAESAHCQAATDRNRARRRFGPAHPCALAIPLARQFHTWRLPPPHCVAVVVFCPCALPPSNQFYGRGRSGPRRTGRREVCQLPFVAARVVAMRMWLTQRCVFWTISGVRPPNLAQKTHTAKHGVAGLSQE